MGFRPLINAFLPKQCCVLCTRLCDFCICRECAKEFSKRHHRCQSCACLLISKLDFCGACLSHSPIFNKAWTIYDYEGIIAHLIKQFKYHKKLCIGAYFGNKLAQTYQQISDKYDVIIPMPLNKKRIKERGYNQVTELLRPLSRQQNITIDNHSCIRQKPTQSLTQLTLKQRKKEIRGAFAIKQPIRYQRILLVDDVMTTGSSLNELSKTILKSNPKASCDVLTLARAK